MVVSTSECAFVKATQTRTKTVVAVPLISGTGRGGGHVVTNAHVHYTQAGLAPPRAQQVSAQII